MRLLAPASIAWLLIPAVAHAQQVEEGVVLSDRDGVLVEESAAATRAYPTLRLADGSPAAVSGLGGPWQFTPSLSLATGRRDAAEAEVATSLPVLVIDWALTDTVQLGTLTTAEGETSLHAAYRVNEAVTVGVGASFESFTFSSRAGAENSESVEPAGGMPLFATATFTPNPYLSLSVTGGVSFDGGSAATIDRLQDGPAAAGDTAPFVGLSGSLRF